jgi:transposase
VIADGRGRAVAFALAPGQAHEPPMAPGLLDCLPDLPGWVVGDRGLASDAFRERIWDIGARPAIPPRRTDAPVACPPWIYANRHLVENCAVPGCGGAFSHEQEDALWQQVFTAQPARRREFEPSSKRRKRRPASWPPATG